MAQSRLLACRCGFDVCRDVLDMRYISLCSGIEAVSVAWHPLGYEPVAFSEVEPFPCAVLAERWPGVPNVGDITKIDGRSYHGTVDIVVGGTPCQGFSIAGKRGGLDDERSGLARDFVRIVSECRPRWFVWENVPGALSTNGGREFGTFIRAMDECGYHLAWRIVDAQFFGTPQRRRRIFLIGHSGDWRRSATVLFEREGVRRDTPQSRQKRPDIVGSLTVSSGTNGADDNAAQAGHLVITKCLTSHGYRFDTETENFIPQAGGIRRLTPVEWERLMGFPDGYTAVTYRGKPAADSPRYRALGNSMAVPIMRWLGERIEAVDRRT